MRSRLLGTVVGRAGSAGLACLCAAGLDAGLAAAEPISLDEEAYVARARQADPRGALLDADIDASWAEVRAAGVLANPSLSYDREETFLAGEGAPENVIRAGWTLDLSGRRGRQLAAAEAGVAATRAEVAARRLGLGLEARRAYRQAAYLKLRAELLGSERAALAGLVAVLEKRSRAGDAAGYDLRRLELELGNHDDLVASAEGELALERRRLAIMIGEPDADVEPKGSLPVPGQPGGRGDDAVLVGNRLDHQATQLRTRQADAELAAAARAWVPLVGLSGGVKTIDLGDETATGYVAGISLTLPIFDHGQAGAARANAARRRAMAEARALEVRVPAAVRLARESLARRIAQLQSYESTQLGRLDTLARTAEASYREGERSISELLDAYRTAREIRLRAVELRRDAAMAEVDLMDALGRGP